MNVIYLRAESSPYPICMYPVDTMTVAEAAAKALREAYPDQLAFTLVGTGTSGAIMLTALGFFLTNLLKDVSAVAQVTTILYRKESEDCHRSHSESKGAPREGSTVVFVDDAVSSGNTLRYVHSQTLADTHTTWVSEPGPEDGHYREWRFPKIHVLVLASRCGSIGQETLKTLEIETLIHP